MSLVTGTEKCTVFVGELCGWLRDSALQWQAVVNTAMNITFLGDCQLLQKSLLQAHCPSADILFPFFTNAANFLRTLERHCNYNIKVL